MQVESLGQQKEEGKSDPHCWRPALPPHVSAWRRKRLDACAVGMRDRKRQARDILESLGEGVTGAMVVEMEVMAVLG